MKQKQVLVHCLHKITEAKRRVACRFLEGFIVEKNLQKYSYGKKQKHCQPVKPSEISTPFGVIRVRE